ncbi:hypothetical protein [Pleomorphomonas sp. T1.2MG-36]|jgi:hypothetical protein|uniref:hypothetical protein n=1 Tax=Pleomorphomonas sp. T1.2MG-36 TaxID=3041167 RepID=UPI00253FB82B|nr:hypothetical protein [Pleomorphomonas sp. T1.2MG-36]
MPEDRRLSAPRFFSIERVMNAKPQITRLPTSADYFPAHDHARLPWRFLARQTGDSRLRP